MMSKVINKIKLQIVQKIKEKKFKDIYYDKCECENFD